MLAYSPLFTPPNGSEWSGAFDDPSIYYNGLQDFNTQTQFFSFDHYNDHHSSFDDQLIVPPPSSPVMIFSPLPPPLDADQTSLPAVSSGVAAAAAMEEEREEMRDEKKKKQDHNASERNRRMRINSLYSSLRSLLPATDQMKKLSIPNTIGRALKYIPELQNEVQELIERKEKLLPTAPTTSVFSQAYNNNTNTNTSKTTTCTSASSPTSTTTSTSVEAALLGNGEISIQISSLKSNTVVVPISEVLRELEEDYGIVVVDVSSSESSAGRVFHRIHLMVEASDEMKCQLLREKVLSLCQRWENMYCLWMN